MLLGLAFALCTAAIVFAGTRLSRYGDVIAEKTGMGRTWVGVVLMASVTSLPELMTGIGAVTYAAAPDIAAGDVLGSCVFNLLILALLDAMHRPLPLSSKARQGHTLSAGFGILLLGLVALGIVIGNRGPALGWIGLSTVFLVVIYLVAMRLLYFYEKKQIAQFLKEAAQEFHYADIPLARAVRHYSVNALIVIVAALFLPGIGTRIAAATGLGQSFVGNILIAVSTSLPEVVVSLAAVRIGAIDLAIGNLFGSNIFNAFILGLDDIFFVPGPLLASVSASQIFSALTAIMMTAVAIVGLTYRAERKVLPIAWDSVVIVLLYLINLALLYNMR